MQVWLTVEEAAVKTGMSVRTLQRRIASGAMASRMENGRREVQIELPDSPASAGDTISGQEITIPTAPAAAAGQALNEIQVGAGLTQLSHALAALADNADHKAEMAVVAYQGLARSAEIAAGRYRLETRIYQGVAAVLVLALLGAVGLAVRSYTVAGTLAQEVEKAGSSTANVGQERDKLRDELWMAKEAAARAEGEAAARMHALPVKVNGGREPATVIGGPTTRPATLVDRVAGMLIQIPMEGMKGGAAEAQGAERSSAAAADEQEE